MLMFKNKQLFFRLFVIIVMTQSHIYAQTWQSSKIYFGADNKLVYVTDTGKNVIPDFSYAGYKRSEVPIPFVPVVKTISPVSGDNTANIQNAINTVGAMPIDANGIRGALYLNPGVYNVYGVLTITNSGVVLRGAGNGIDTMTSTVIYGRGDTPTQRDLITAGGGNSTLWADSVKGTKTNITTPFVQVGSHTFTVASAASYAVGDNIIIYHPCTDAWLQAINYGSTHDTSMSWQSGDVPIFFNRRITAIKGNDITVDAPIFNHLNKSLSQSYIYKYSRSNIKTNIGIENLRVEIENAGGTDENHIWNSIVLTQIEDSWVKNCVTLHFGYSGILTLTASRITIDSCQALDPVCVLSGERADNFNTKEASQLILIKNCIARKGRHHFVVTGTGHASGNVFLYCKSIGNNNPSEGHRHWSQGLLYDNLRDSLPNNNSTLGLYNRGSMGSGHGWAAVHSVAWNCNASGKEIYIQQPPTAQNYGIGCSGIITAACPPAPFAEATGFIEGSNKSGLNPPSLFLAQLAERLQSTDVSEKNKTSIPDGLEVLGNYPNPFNPSTVIEYRLEKRDRVEVKIFDILGNELTTLSNMLESPGKKSLVWDPSSQHLNSGVYFCRILTSGTQKLLKLVYLK